MSIVSSVFSYSSRSSTSSFHVSDRVALFMDSILAIGAGLGLRFVVDLVSHHDLKLTGTIVGLWEGIVLLHFLQKFPYSFDPYVGYGVRLFVDFLVTESVARLAVVVIWTGLGMILADVTPTLWKEMGMRRRWHNLRRELYLLTRSVPTMPPLFTKPRTVRFSPSRTASVVSSASRAPSVVTESSAPPTRPARTLAVPQTPRMPRRPVPGFYPPSEISETDTERSGSVVIRPVAFSDTDSLTTTNIGTATGFTRHDRFARTHIDDDISYASTSSTSTTPQRPDPVDLPEIIVPEDPATPRQEVELLEEEAPPPEPEPEPEDNEPMPNSADIPDIPNPPDTGDLFDHDWETVERSEAVPAQISTPPPPPPKDEEPLYASAAEFGGPSYIDVQPPSSLFAIDQPALSPSALQPLALAIEPIQRASGVATPEPKPVPPPVVDSNRSVVGDTAASKAASVVGVPSRAASAVGTPSKAGSVVGAPSKAGSAVGAPSRAASVVGKAESEIGAPSKAPSAFSAPSKAGSVVGTPSRAGSVVGAPSKAGSAIGAPSKAGSALGAPSKPGSVVGASSKPESVVGASGKPESVVGASSKPGSVVGAPSKPASVFGGVFSRAASVFGGGHSRAGSVVGAPSKAGSAVGAPSKAGSVVSDVHAPPESEAEAPTTLEPIPAAWGKAASVAPTEPTPSELHSSTEPARTKTAWSRAGSVAPTEPTPSELHLATEPASTKTWSKAGSVAPTEPTPSELHFATEPTRARNPWTKAASVAPTEPPLSEVSEPVSSRAPYKASSVAPTEPTPTESHFAGESAPYAASVAPTEPTPSELHGASAPKNPWSKAVSVAPTEPTPSELHLATEPAAKAPHKAVSVAPTEPTPTELHFSTESARPDVSRAASVAPTEPAPSEALEPARTSISKAFSIAPTEPTPSELHVATERTSTGDATTTIAEHDTEHADDAPPPPYPELWSDRQPSPIPSADSSISVRSESSVLRDAIAHQQKLVKYLKQQAELDDEKSTPEKAKAVKSKLKKMDERAERKFLGGNNKESLSNELDVSLLTAPKAVEAVEGRLAALLSVNMVEKVVLVTTPRTNTAKGRGVKTKLLASLKEHGFSTTDDPNNGRILRITLPPN